MDTSADGGRKAKYVVEAKHASMLWLAILAQIFRNGPDDPKAFWDLICSCYNCTLMPLHNTKAIDTKTSIVELTFAQNENSILAIDVQCDNINLAIYAAENIIRQSIIYKLSDKVGDTLQATDTLSIANDNFRMILLACFDYTSTGLFRDCESIEDLETIIRTTFFSLENTLDSFLATSNDYRQHNTFIRIKKQDIDLSAIASALPSLD